MAEPMLSVRDLHAWYGESHVLHGMSLDIHPGEVVTLLGRNGMGKTTTISAILGLLKPRGGWVRFAGVDVRQGFRGHAGERSGHRIGGNKRERGRASSDSIVDLGPVLQCTIPADPDPDPDSVVLEVGPLLRKRIHWNVKPFS
jgi:ABC-type cobalamin/Fe3+-siderophores transport system ATPase subunit